MLFLKFITSQPVMQLASNTYYISSGGSKVENAVWLACMSHFTIISWFEIKYDMI